MNLDPDQPITRPRTPIATIQLGPTDEVTVLDRSILIGAHQITLSSNPAAFGHQARDLARAAVDLMAQARLATEGQ